MSVIKKFNLSATNKLKNNEFKFFNYSENLQLYYMLTY